MDAKDAVKRAAMTKAAIVGAKMAMPVAGSMLSTAATAATRALGPSAFFVATSSTLPLLVPLALIGAAAYGSAKLVKWAFELFEQHPPLAVSVS
jgi:hypothetical protein